MPEQNDDFSITPARTAEGSVDATIIIPTYQAEATLPRAMDSALDQTMRNIEVIVADDASTDSSRRLIADRLRREPRLRVLANRRNCGKSATMNRAARFARGRWVAVLDADDWYHRDRMAALVAAGERAHADLVADNQLMYDAAAETIVGTAWPPAGVDWELNFDDYLLGSDVYDAFSFGMLKPLVRAEFLRATNLSYNESTRYGEDFFYLLDFFLRGGKTAICDAPYYFYTQPFGTVSQEWSHATRRRYDFQQAYHINENYVGEVGPRLTPQQSQQLKTRSRRLAALEGFFRVREALAGREWHRLLRRLLRHPVALDCAVRRLLGRYVRRSTTPVAVRVAQDCRQRAAERSARRRRAAGKQRARRETHASG